ncbi:hypothetical protein [Absidia glauca]|uniref:Uncharacterized protein n=1 Tax=Absidia glauca TaxID=4829 RepID=A0A163K146_ABSGL|nr:hypothetical protein [Absidia glauca]
MNGAYLTSLPREMMRPLEGFPTNCRSFYLARAALDSPTSLCKSYSRRSTNDMTDWRPKNSTRCSRWNPTPAIPIGNIQSSLIQSTCRSKGICCKLKLRNTILPSSNNLTMTNIFFSTLDLGYDDDDDDNEDDDDDDDSPTALYHKIRLF